MERHLYQHTYLGDRYEDVVQAINEHGPEFLGGSASAARDHADEIVTNLHVEIAGLDVSKTVDLELGEPETLDEHATRWLVNWHAEDGDTIFPAMRAYLEVAALSVHPPLTQVSFIGHYEPPLGVIGAAADRLVGHRVAEATIDAFLRDVKWSIHRYLGSQATATPS